MLATYRFFTCQRATRLEPCGSEKSLAVAEGQIADTNIRGNINPQIVIITQASCIGNDQRNSKSWHCIPLGLKKHFKFKLRLYYNFKTV